MSFPRSRSGGICNSIVLIRYNKSCRKVPSCTIAWISIFVAEISRTSIGTERVAPRRRICLFSIAVNNFACIGKLKLPISSRNRVPPEATSIRPGLSRRASVKAPFSYPNSSLSNNCSGILPRSILIKTWLQRGE